MKKAARALTDGMLIKALWKNVVRPALIAISSNKTLGFIANVVACINPISCTAYAFASTYAVTGDFGMALKAGAITAATLPASNYIDNIGVGRTMTKIESAVRKAVAHGAVGGTVSILQGGKFGHAALRSATLSFASSLLGGDSGNECKSPCNAEVEILAKTPEELSMALEHLEKLVGDPAVNQSSLEVARFNVAVAIRRSRFTEFTSTSINQGVFEVDYYRSQQQAVFAVSSPVLFVEAPMSTAASLGLYVATTPEGMRSSLGALKALGVGRTISTGASLLGRATASKAGENIWNFNGNALSFGVDPMIPLP